MITGDRNTLPLQLSVLTSPFFTLFNQTFNASSGKGFWEFPSCHRKVAVSFPLFPVLSLLRYYYFMQEMLHELKQAL